ncbi:MAG: hypothetical protein LLG40_06640 [Deltaproteobacteria bacterium]|nr:hypothetical protein [Deltaproteobacteria bacterium]
MQNEINKNKSRNVTKKDIVSACVIIVIAITALFIGEVYSKNITFIIWGALAILAVIHIYRLPKKETESIGAAIEAHDKTTLGRVMKIIQYVIYIVIGAGIIFLLINKMST